MSCVSFCSVDLCHDDSVRVSSGEQYVSKCGEFKSEFVSVTDDAYVT